MHRALVWPPCPPRSRVVALATGWPALGRAPAAASRTAVQAAAASRPVGPTWISVPIAGQTPQSKHGVQRQSSTSARPRVERVLPVLPEPVPVQPGVEVVPGQHLVVARARGWCTRPVDAVAGQRLGGAPRPALVGEVLAPAVEPAAVLPSRPDHLGRPAGRRGRAGPRRCRACRRGSGSRSPCRTLRSARSAARAPAAGRRRSRGAHCAAHWNGVCGLGTKPPIETVQRMSRRPVASRPALITLRASRRSAARPRRSRSAART